MLRILHVVGSMKRGGIETWLVSLLRHLDRGKFRFDFMVSAQAPSPWEPEIRAAGGRIIVCMSHSRPLRYAVNFGRAAREYGPWDVVHSHLHHLGGLVAWLGWRAGAPGRVVHSHFDTSALDSADGVARRLRYRLAGRLMRRYATGWLAVSARAAAALFGPAWKNDPRSSLFPLGFEPCREPVDRAAVRAELGIPAGAFVVGHAGRFVEQKNHRFLVEMAAALPRARFLLVGDGPTRREIEERVRAGGMADRFHFTGLRADAPRLMAGAMDVFALPSFYEGLPFVLLEAQAAGLPCLVADNIAEEADVIPLLVRRLPLAAGAADWAEAALGARGMPRAQALAAIESSPFDVRNSVRQLEEYYQRQAATR